MKQEQDTSVGELTGGPGYTVAVFEAPRDIPAGDKLYIHLKMGVVGWQFYQGGHWYSGNDRIHNHRKNTEEAGIPTRDVYAILDSGNV